MGQYLSWPLSRESNDDWSTYQTLNVQQVGDFGHGRFLASSTLQRADYLRWMEENALQPSEGFLALRHSVFHGQHLHAASVLYIPTVSSPGDLEYGGVRFYHGRYPELEGVQLLPHHLHMICGTVVSRKGPPLNIQGREAFVAVLKRRLADEAMKLLLDASANPVVWRTVWDTYSWHLKLGVCNDPSTRGATLLRYRTSRFPRRGSSLANYLARMPEDQDKIYFARGPSVDTLECNVCVKRLVKAGKEVKT